MWIWYMRFVDVNINMIHIRFVDVNVTHAWHMSQVDVSVTHVSHSCVTHLSHPQISSACAAAIHAACISLQLKWMWTRNHHTYISESCHIYLRVMSHLFISHVTFIYESCHIYLRVMSRTGFNPSQRSWRYDLKMAVPCVRDIYLWVMSDSHMYQRVMPRTSIWRDS